MNATSVRQKSRWLGITLRTALLAWVVAIVTLLLFVVVLLPRQKTTFLESLRSKAYGVTVSLREVAAGAVVNEDFSSVVDHCTEMLRGDPSLDYIVITRNDGFSLVLDRSSWSSKNLDGRWRPAKRTPAGDIEASVLFKRRVYAYSQPFDYSGIEWGWIHVGLSLEAYDRNIVAMYQQTSLLALVCVVFSLAASVVYAKRLVRPILSLQQTVQRIADGDLSARAQVGQEDELGSLASSVNTMTDALLRRDRFLKEANDTLELRVAERTQELQAQVAAREIANRKLASTQNHLLELSHAAGMAEVATGVLHNVGNVLNSVNVSANLLRERLSHTGAQRLERTVALLREHQADLPHFLTVDPNGRHVVDFLDQLARHLAAQQSNLQTEIENVCHHVDHIKEIVAMQQNYAKPGGLVERVAPAQLCDDALTIKEDSCQRHRIVVERDYAAVPLVTVERHRVIQILINLLANAIAAIDASDNPARRILVRVTAVRETRMQFVVSDTGVGIPAENMTRIFSHGFTTRRDGHGFGLHSAANTAKTLGGTLAGASPGPGLGATFTLELPVELPTRSP